MARSIDVFVGDRIRDRRIELGVTQESLAGMVGITDLRLNEIETGRAQIDPNTVAWIAMALDCKLSWLFGMKTEPVPGLGFTAPSAGLPHPG